MIPSNRIRKPDPVSFFKKNDFGHSFKGIVAGLVVMAIAIANLTLFFGLYTKSSTEVIMLLNVLS
jgi:hypothetical protein